MFGKIRRLAGDFANVVTLWGLMVSLGVSGALGIVGPTVLQPILGLPAGLRAALGLCIFLIALAAILAGLNALIERHSQGKPVQAPTPPVMRESAPDAPPNPYPPIRDDELDKRFFEKRTVYIADFASKVFELDLIDSVDLLLNAPVIRGRVFEDCRIHGPAVLVEGYTPEKTEVLAGTNSWKGGKPFWDAREGEHHTGAIVLKNSTFRGCRFVNVGFLPPKKTETDEEGS